MCYCSSTRGKDLAELVILLEQRQRALQRCPLRDRDGDARGAREVDGGAALHRCAERRACASSKTQRREKI